MTSCGLFGILSARENGFQIYFECPHSLAKSKAKVFKRAHHAFLCDNNTIWKSARDDRKLETNWVIENFSAAIEIWIFAFKSENKVVRKELANRKVLCCTFRSLNNSWLAFGCVGFIAISWIFNKKKNKQKYWRIAYTKGFASARINK